MHKQAMINAFISAKNDNVTLMRYAFFVDNCYCPVAWLASYAGMPDKVLAQSDVEHITQFVSINYCVEPNYLDRLMAQNDASFKSWDDAIAFVKEK